MRDTQNINNNKNKSLYIKGLMGKCSLHTGHSLLIQDEQSRRGGLREQLSCWQCYQSLFVPVNIKVIVLSFSQTSVCSQSGLSVNMANI